MTCDEFRYDGLPYERELGTSPIRGGFKFFPTPLHGALPAFVTFCVCRFAFVRLLVRGVRRTTCGHEAKSVERRWRHR